MSFKDSWLKSLGDKGFVIRFGVTIASLIVLLTCLTNFLIYNETRTGVIIDDPFLSLFSPIDLTWFTFALIYTGLITAIAALIQNPPKFIIVLQAYIIMILIRILAMYSLPLDPPSNMIVLQDPVVTFFGNSDIYVKDLFFSGHTSTMFLLYLTAERKKLKYLFFLFTILVAAAVLVQHVHYSVDVIVAPFAAYASYRIAHRINRNN